MAFHAHHHRYRRNIPKSGNEVGMEREEFILLDIRRGYPSKEFDNQWISIRISVLWYN